jgi:hypothetical protein
VSRVELERQNVNLITAAALAEVVNRDVIKLLAGRKRPHLTGWAADGAFHASIPRFGGSAASPGTLDRSALALRGTGHQRGRAQSGSRKPGP